MEQSNSKKIHLVLSSGGVKCFSYFGATETLLQNNYEIATISACSMGTVIGGLIATGIDIQELRSRILNFNFSAINKSRLFGILGVACKPYASKHLPNYKEVIESILGRDYQLKELTIPFSALALDISRNRLQVYSDKSHPEMYLSKLISIATAVPLMYGTEIYGGSHIADAAIMTKSPAWIANSQLGNYPIITLKLSVDHGAEFDSKLSKYVYHIFNAIAESNDYFISSQIKRQIEILISTRDIAWDNTQLSRKEIEYLYVQGALAMDSKLMEYDFDFTSILLRQNGRETINTKSNSKASFSNESYNYGNKAEKIAKTLMENFPDSKRNQIFLSYAHEDKAWIDKFENSFKTMDHYLGIKIWTDLEINPGDDWKDAIEVALVNTKVAIFFVTNSFLASKFIRNNEMGYFMEMRKKYNIPIFWISVEPSLYEYMQLKEIQCANTPSKPLSSLSDSEQKEEINNLCKRLIKIFNES